MLRRIKELWDRITELLTSVGFLLLLGLYALYVLSPVIVPFVVGYAVFVVVSSPVDSTVKAIMFAAYSFGLFAYGAYLEGYGWKEKVKEVKELLNGCEGKVLSVMDDVMRCIGANRYRRRCREVMASVESKIFSAVRCIEGAKEKL